jgi:iron complex outermembrane receptor protein
MMCKSFTAALLVSACLTPPAYAQTATSETPIGDATQATAPSGAGATGSAAPDVGLEDIVVTAQRRPERLQNVPLSVTAVSGDLLKTRGLNDLAQISLVAPSLQISNDNNFAVRGVGTQAFSSSIESSVGFAQDEVNLTNPGLVSDFFDVAQVEVLNGPQGLLFGRNASAGLLNVTTARPKLGVLGASFDMEADYRDTAASNSSGAIARASLNLPVGEKAALRISSFYNYQQPLVNFRGVTTNRNDLELRRYALRGKFLYEPNDSFSLYVIGDYGEEHGVLGLFDQTYRELAPDSVNAGPLAPDGIVPGPKNIDFAGDGGYFRDLKRRGIQGKISYTLANGIEISDIAAWRSFDRSQQIDQDFTSQNGANVNRTRASFDQYSNEFRVALPSGDRLSGQAGLYLFHSKLDSQAQVGGNNYFPTFLLPNFPFCVGAVATPGAFPPTCSTTNSFFLGNDRVVQQRNNSYAAFGQLTYKVTEQLQLIAGGRVTHDRIEIDLTQNNDRYFVPLGIPYTGSQDYKNTNFSWRGGAQYNFTPNAMVYGTYGRGYKGPGFNDNAVTPTASLVVRPETNNNIEIGAKTSWLNRRVVANVSLFRSRFSNYQAQSLDLTTSSFIIQNAASLKTKGIEGTLIVRPVDGLTINSSVTLLDSKFGDFPGAQCYPTQGCTTFNAGGRRAPLSPKFTSTVQAVYEFNTGGDARPFIEANYYHRSPVQYQIAPSPGSRFGNTDILGGSVGVRSDQWRASIFCKNCTDQRVPVSIGVDAGDSFAGNTSYTQGFGLNSFRTIGVLFGFDF